MELGLLLPILQVLLCVLVHSSLPATCTHQHAMLGLVQGKARLW